MGDAEGVGMKCFDEVVDHKASYLPTWVCVSAVRIVKDMGSEFSEGWHVSVCAVVMHGVMWG